MSEKTKECFGILRIPQEFLIDLLTGHAKLEIPEGARVYSIHERYDTMSLDVTLMSNEPIEDYTDHVEIGCHIPQSLVKIVRAGLIGGKYRAGASVDIKFDDELETRI
jgi:hypothetical protein